MSCLLVLHFQVRPDSWVASSIVSRGARPPRQVEQNGARRLAPLLYTELCTTIKPSKWPPLKRGDGTSAPLPTSSCRMARTSITRWSKTAGAGGIGRMPQPHASLSPLASERYSITWIIDPMLSLPSLCRVLRRRSLKNARRPLTNRHRMLTACRRVVPVQRGLDDGISLCASNASR